MYQHSIEYFITFQPNSQHTRSDVESVDKNSLQSSSAVHLSEADRLNGNNQQPSPTATIQSHSQRPPGSPVLATVKSRPTPPPKPPLYSHEESASSNNSKNGSSGGAATASGTARTSSTTNSSSSPSSFYSSSVNATTNQARTMGSILKGSVMDKVTHVFNTTTSVSSPTPASPSVSSTGDTRPSNPSMGNTNNKESGDGSAVSSGSGDAKILSTRELKGKERRTSTPEISSTSQSSNTTGIGSGMDLLNTSPSPTSAINIPKGKNILRRFI